MQFHETRSQNFANISAILQKRDDIFKFKNVYKKIFWYTLFILSKWIWIIFPLKQEKFCFPDFLKDQKKN